MNLEHIIDSNEVMDTTADIITSYVARNKVSIDDMCATIGTVYTTVHSLSRTNRVVSFKELLNGGIDNNNNDNDDADE